MNDLVCAAVLSGNRNFEARIHPNLRANFLMSPALVVAFALAGTVLWDPETDPLGTDHAGNKVFLRDIMPGDAEVAALLPDATDPGTYQRLYTDPGGDNALWNQISAPPSEVYTWKRSHYIAEPPFFSEFAMHPGTIGDIRGARCLGIFGDSLTTDHISPAGAINETTPAGQYLIRNGIAKNDFQSYGTRRGNHDIMIRGTFANVRIKNLMVPPGPDGARIEGGETVHYPSGDRTSIYEVAYLLFDSLRGPALALSGSETAAGVEQPPLASAELAGFTGAFGHRRLSIIDLSPAGHQPMGTADGRCWITYNGEIYYYLELRRELGSLGARFRTASDTEVLIQAYRHWGPAMLRRLVGMFAFAILDLERRKLLLARDHSESSRCTW